MEPEPDETTDSEAVDDPAPRDNACVVEHLTGILSDEPTSAAPVSTSR